QKGWRRLHYASFAAFVLALGHALTTGSDLKGVGGPVLAALSAGPVVWLVFYRVLAPRPGRAAGSVAKAARGMRTSADSTPAAPITSSSRSASASWSPASGR